MVPARGRYLIIVLVAQSALAKVRVSGRRDTRQLHEEREQKVSGGTQMRNSKMEKEENYGDRARQMWQTLRDTEKKCKGSDIGFTSS